MTKEDLENKCMEYSQNAAPSYTNGYFDRYAIAQAYEDGARWRINEAWHDVSQRPDEHEAVIIEREGDKLSYHENGYDGPWEYNARQFGFKRWAYIKDLLPMWRGENGCN